MIVAKLARHETRIIYLPWRFARVAVVETEGWIVVHSGDEQRLRRNGNGFPHSSCRSASDIDQKPATLVSFEKKRNSAGDSRIPQNAPLANSSGEND
jgi:hypothetical protein